MITRRELLISSLPIIGSIAVIRRSAAIASLVTDSSQFERQLRQIEEKSGGQLGVAVLDTSNGTMRGYRQDERFPMCSTFKLLAVAAVLSRVDQGKEELERRIHFTNSDIVSYSPVTETHVGGRHVG